MTAKKSRRKNLILGRQPCQRRKLKSPFNGYIALNQSHPFDYYLFIMY
jgi:hypothetical protein